MTDTLKSNDNLNPLQGLEDFKGCIELPLPPVHTHTSENALKIELYARFMRHLRMVPNSQDEIKILSAIQFTADMTDLRDDLVSKILVDLGLRAPRKAFPTTYLEYADKSLMRSGFEVGGPGASTIALKKYWDELGEDRFAAFRKDYPVAEIPVMT